MQLLHLKLNNGEDLLAYGQRSKDNGKITVIEPILIQLDPEAGIFAKTWLMFSDKNSVELPVNSFMFIHKASNKSVEYYQEFNNRLEDQSSSSNDQCEELFEAVLQSKNSTKH